MVSFMLSACFTRQFSPRGSLSGFYLVLRSHSVSLSDKLCHGVWLGQAMFLGTVSDLDEDRFFVSEAQPSYHEGFVDLLCVYEFLQ
jgi:hypothetical protein